MMGTLLSRTQQDTNTTTIGLQQQQQETTCEEENGVHGHGPALRIPDCPPTIMSDHVLPQSTLQTWSKTDVKDHATAYRAFMHIRKASIRVVDMRLEWIVDTLVPSVMSLSSSTTATTGKKNDTTCSISLPAQFTQVIQAEIHGVHCDNGALEMSLNDDHRIHVAPSSDPIHGTHDDAPASTIQRFSIQIELCANDQKHVTLIDMDIMGDDKYHVHARSQLLVVDGQSLYYSPLYGMPDAEKDNAANRPECIICLTELKSAALVPCQHLCLCASCALILKMQHDPNNRRCPVCRTLIDSILILECKEDDEQQLNNVETREGP